ncbi:MAG: hypothetical protein GXP30_14350 [Verrucomicrobia bacterium]|nr:hypothetical protein [Verrucomicrobiota bacterium]
MSKHLSVYLYDSLVGQLEQDKHGRISFVYCQTWLEAAPNIFHIKCAFNTGWTCGMKADFPKALPANEPCDLRTR